MYSKVYSQMQNGALCAKLYFVKYVMGFIGTSSVNLTPPGL